MAEPTLQVPVSLLRDALVSIECEDYDPLLVRRLEALLPQSTQTPTEKFREQYVHAPEEWHTPRIEDMAPGTKFRARFTWTEHEYEFKVDSRGDISFHVWQPMPRLDRIDPSTIRDVTPPAGG